MAYRIEKAHIRDLKRVKPFWKGMVRQIREVTGDDWPVRDPDESWQRRHQEYLTWLNDGAGVVFLAVADDGEAVGYAAVRFTVSGSAFDTGERFGSLETLTVAEGHRGKGVGQSLLTACRDELRKREIGYWSLDTLATNNRAKQLYQRAGFSEFVLRMVQNLQDADRADASALASTEASRSAMTTSPVIPGDVSQSRVSGPAAASADPGSVVARVTGVAQQAREAARVLGLLSRAEKDAAVIAMADALLEARSSILAANAIDIDRGLAKGMAESLLDRLRLDEQRLAGIAQALREVANLPDPVGEVVRGATMPNGLEIRQVRVPFGVIGMIYEARPNVTVDAAGLCLKSGNAVILRGGSAASASNKALVTVLRQALVAQGLPAQAISLLDDPGREAAVALMRARGLVDVIIPRGGADLIATVVRESSVPVIETGSGNVHVYVDADADLGKALDIVINAKTQRPSVCNAAETLLVHADVAATFLPTVLRELADRGVRLHGDERTVAAGACAGVDVEAATEQAYDTEFHALEMAVAVVDSIDAALAHVRRYSTGHTEAIVTESRAMARRWVAEVDAAVVVVNASTRFTDGGEFGFGAEIGISTQKLHARGPMALAEMTSTKWIVDGDGQIRG